MTAYIQTNDRGNKVTHNIVLKEWDLDKQIIMCGRWIRRNSHKIKGRKWILDIGYSDGARDNVVACGYTVSLEFMELCVKNKIILWLSSYGERFDVATNLLMSKSNVTVNEIKSVIKLR